MMYSSSPISRGRSAGDEAGKGYVATAKAIRGRGLHGMSTGVASCTAALGRCLLSCLGVPLHMNLLNETVGINFLNLCGCQ